MFRLNDFHKTPLAQWFKGVQKIISKIWDLYIFGNFKYINGWVHGTFWPNNPFSLSNFALKTWGSDLYFKRMVVLCSKKWLFELKIQHVTLRLHTWDQLHHQIWCFNQSETSASCRQKSSNMAKMMIFPNHFCDLYL